LKFKVSGFVWIEEGICEEGREWICEDWRGCVRICEVVWIEG